MSRHLVVLACRVVLDDSVGVEEERALTNRMHALATTKVEQQQGCMSQQLADGFTVRCRPQNHLLATTRARTRAQAHILTDRYVHRGGGVLRMS